MSNDNHIPQDLIDSWRQAQSISVPQDFKKLEGEPPRVLGIMSCPRLCWSDNIRCALSVLGPLGIPMMITGGVNWGQGLTRLMQLAVNHGVEFILTLDYDSIFDHQNVARLFQLMVENSDVDAIVPVQVKREHNTSMFTIFADGEMKTEIKASEFMKPLTRIATGHFGLTMIRTESLSRLSKPWFRAIPDLNGEWEAGHIDEDIYFWLNAMSVGWKVCLANEVRIGHLQRIITWPKPDFTPMFQYISGWHENGKPNLEMEVV